jgi:hypothetical protein
MCLAKCMCPSGPYVWPSVEPLHSQTLFGLVMNLGLPKAYKEPDKNMDGLPTK